MDWKIEKVRLDWGQIPVDVLLSSGRQPSFHFVFVRLFAGGVSGIGEVIIPVTDNFTAFLQSLVGSDVRRLDSLLPLTDNDQDRILLEAVSMALHDLLGHLSGLPLHVFLGGTTQPRVPLMPCIFPDSPQRAREKAQEWFSKGYRFLKVKLSGEISEDLARVKAVRQTAPPDSYLQGDANFGYKSFRDAVSAVKQLADAGLNAFEDPLQGDISDYRRLRDALKSTDVKLLLDILVRRTRDLLAVLRNEAADEIFIHADQVGSLSRIMRHVHMAEAYGVPAVIGGTGYTGIGSAVYQHIAAVATPGRRCGELGGSFDHGMPRSSVKQPLPMADGCVILPDTPGIGVELDEGILDEFGTGSAQWS